MYCSWRAVLSLFLFLMCCTHLTSQLTVVTSQRHQLLRTQFLLYQSTYLVSPTFSMPTVGKALPRAHFLSSAEFLAQLEEKECQKQLATEQKEQGKKEWVEKKAVREQMQKQKAEERAEKAGERARKSGCNEREGINQPVVLRTQLIGNLVEMSLQTSIFIILSMETERSTKALWLHLPASLVQLR